MNTCIDGCCRFVIYPTKTYKTIPYKIKNPKKGGVIVYNSLNKRILLVQSRGKLWGFPKGTLEPPETLINCALRELKEETGIELTEKCINVEKRINVNKTFYFFYDTIEEIGSVQYSDPFNDVNGLVWINFSCIKKLHETSNFKLNSQCRYVLKNTFKIDLNYKRNEKN